MDEVEFNRYMEMLSAHHKLQMPNDMEIVVDDLDEYNPFRRFLKRSIYKILEFDKVVAFVFRSHILFFGKEDNQIRVHMKPEKPKGFFARLFGGRD